MTEPLRRLAPAPASRSAVSRGDEDIVDALARVVVELGLVPGDRLPDERNLAKRLGVARSTVREGLRHWQGMNVIARRQGSGTWLRMPVTAGAVAFGPGGVDVPSARDLVHTLEVRRALEGEAASLCAERARPADLERIRAALEAMERANARYGGAPNEDRVFHETVWRAAGNPVLERLVASLGRSLTRMWENPVGTAEFGKASLPFHRTMVDAILARDPVQARGEAFRLVDSVIADVRRAARLEVIAGSGDVA